jgi:hypothetical protein
VVSLIGKDPDEDKDDCEEELLKESEGIGRSPHAARKINPITTIDKGLILYFINLNSQTNI